LFFSEKRLAANIFASRFFICCQPPKVKIFIGGTIMAAIKLPSFQQLISMAIAIAILFFLIKLLPENIRQFFRV